MGALNSQGYFETSNPAWKSVLGWSEDEVASMSIFELLHPDDVERTRTGFNLTQQGQPAIRFPNRYRCKDGSYRWISWVGVPEDGFVYCSGRDITDEKVQSEALERTQDALRQSQKMEAVGQLTGGLAHDFNNLLAGIGGNLELMQARIAQGRIDTIGRYVLSAQGAVKRAAALTHRLLAFSRRQTLDPSPTNINRLVSDMEELVRRTVGPAVDVVVGAAAELWSTFVDRNQLENALLNLCINARDAMPMGGRLAIETANVVLDDRAGNERDLPGGEYVTLSVTDTGTGMTTDVIAQAFDPFFTTKPLGQGTGLGLSMIYGFARQSGGQVWIESDVGHGTTMRIYLPRHAADADGVEGGDAPVTVGRSARGGVVLVVDDEPTIRMLVAEELQETGYTVLEASDGPSALKVLSTAGHIDFLVTDVGLPGGMNGRQIADLARVQRPHLLVLFITGYAPNAAVGSGNLDDGMAILTKPFEIEQLVARVQEMLELRNNAEP
jgi:PAS domain S-box-containing protein